VWWAGASRLARMAIDDLWRLKDGTPSKRDGQGLRYRVRVPGWPAKSCRTKEEAKRIEAKRITEGPPTPASTVTVGELVDRWLATKRGLSRNGFASCEQAAMRARPAWGRRMAADVTRHEVASWLANMQVQQHGGVGVRPTHMAPASTRAKTLWCLRGAFDIGVEIGAVDVNPTLGIKPGRQVRRDVSFVEVGTVRALAEAVGRFRQPHNSAMIWFMATTGARIGEVCALTVGDVDVKRGRVRVREAKNGRARDVPVPASVMGMLDLGRPKGDPLFANSAGRRFDQSSWRNQVFNPAKREIGCPELTPHMLRHTAASWAIAAGADVKAVQEMLGHRSAAMTLDVYGHLWARGLDGVSARVDRFIAG